MKALDVDLRTPSRPPRWAWAVVAALGALAIALTAAAAWQARKLDVLKAELDALMREAAKPVAVERPVARKMPYDASAREMLALATSEWPAMLTALESVEMVGATPIAIEIAPVERWLRVDVEFTDYAVLLQYIDALNAGELKSKWALTQAQSSGRSSSVTSVGATSTASIRAAW